MSDAEAKQDAMDQLLVEMEKKRAEREEILQKIKDAEMHMAKIENTIKEFEGVRDRLDGMNRKYFG